MPKRSRQAAPSPPAPISIGSLTARQCVGGPSVDPFHPKPFVGISDLAQATYCEIQSTISQIKMQQGYVTAASMDDTSGGVGAASHDAGRGSAKTKLEREVEKLIADGNVDWETRRAIGRMMEQLELDGISTERRHIEFADFFVIGCPDGISGDSVVEFAASRYPHLTIHAKRIQTNLYAVLWGKPFGRVVVAGIQTIGRLDEVREADPDRAEQSLLRGIALLTGTATPNPPDRTTKCVPCRFNTSGGCTFPRLNRIPSLDEMRSIADL